MEADKFSVHLSRLRFRIASEATEMRAELSHRGFDTRSTLGSDGMLLGRPASGSSVGRPAWMLYESTSTVLRRSTELGDAIDAAAYHLSSIEAATVVDGRVPLLARIVVAPDGRVHLFDPYADSELAGLDRRFDRRGFTVLPTTVVSIDPNDGSVELPVGGDHVPNGRFDLASMVYREIPEAALEGTRVLRLARSLVRHRGTDLEAVTRQIIGLVDTLGDRLDLVSPAAVTARLHGLPVETT